MKIIEKHIFETEQEFLEYIHKIEEEYICKFGEDSELVKVKDIIEHEKAHFSKAVELGYNPKYYANLKEKREYKLKTINFDRRGLSINVTKKNIIAYGITGFSPSSKDLREICLAPKDPSPKDKFLASLIGNYSYRFSKWIKDKK